MINTLLACSVNAITNCFISFRRSNTEVFDLLSGLNGFIGGFVCVSSCCNNIEAWAAIIIGVVGSIIYEFVRRTIRRSEIDDPMETISTHAVCGLWSLIALGLFDNK